MRSHRGEKKGGSPVHILVLVRVDGSTVLRPAHGGFGDAGGLAGQGGLNVDCDRHIVAALSDGRRDWKRRASNISSVWSGVGQQKGKKNKQTYFNTGTIYIFFTRPPTVYLQIHPFLLRPSLIGRHAQVSAGVGHLSRVDV